MDLAKLLENRRQLWKKNPVINEPSSGIFLAQLSSILETDLKVLSKCAAPDEDLSFTALTVHHGKFETSGNKAHRKDINQHSLDYLYIQIPSTTGFLLQANGKDMLILERATQAIPHIVDFHGEAVRKNLFVTYAPVLEEIKVLEENLVRTSAGKTLSLTQCSEMLITLAFDALESTLQEWIHS